MQYDTLFNNSNFSELFHPKRSLQTIATTKDDRGIGCLSEGNLEYRTTLYRKNETFPI